MNKHTILLMSAIAAVFFVGVVTARSALIENGAECTTETACSMPIDAAH